MAAAAATIAELPRRAAAVAMKTPAATAMAGACYLSKVIGTSVVSVRASPNTVARRA